MRPNILLITTDQQRFDALSCNGSGFLRTPRLDALAARGARFERAYCSSPVCTPSRVSIMTGRHPSQHGSYNIGTIATEVPLFLSARLGRAGYRTHHIGKAHFYPWDLPSEENRPVPGMEPLRGFAGFQTAEIAVGHTDWGVTGHYEAWLNERGIFKGRGAPELRVERLYPNDPYGTGEWDLPVRFHSGSWIVERAVRFLDGRPSSRPFFLNLGFQDPHHPHLLPRDFTGRVDPAELPPRRGEYDRSCGHMAALARGAIEESRFAGPLGIAGNTDADWEGYAADARKAAVTAAYYYSMVQLIDCQLGALFEALRQRGLWDRTLIVFTSDHGDMLLNHRLGQKGPLAYEDVIRVPLLISYPGRVRPAAVGACVSLCDLYPTLLDYAGIPPGPDCAGYSLRGLLEGVDEPFAREGCRVEFTEEADAIRYQCYVTRDWKLVIYPGERFGELYDLRGDPGETVNWFDRPEAAAMRHELTMRLLEDLTRCGKRNPRPCRC